jgi:hypothetical protein
VPIRIRPQALASRQGPDDAARRGPAKQQARPPSERRRWPPARGCVPLSLTVGPSPTPVRCPFNAGCKAARSCPELPRVPFGYDRRSRGIAHDPNSAGARPPSGLDGDGADFAEEPVTQCSKQRRRSFRSYARHTPAHHAPFGRTVQPPDAAHTGLALFSRRVSAPLKIAADAAYYKPVKYRRHGG